MPSHRTEMAIHVRMARAVAILDAVERAGLSPIPILHLHAFAYLTNVLSPVWDLLPQKRSILRRRGGPYYPEFQHDIDLLVGLGFVGVTSLSYVEDGTGQWRLDSDFFLREERSDGVLKATGRFADEVALRNFCAELAFAISTLSVDERGRAFAEDATYADQRIGEGAIIDFAEWKRANYSENAARSFDHVMPVGRPASPAEKLHLYVHHLKRRLSNG